MYIVSTEESRTLKNDYSGSALRDVKSASYLHLIGFDYFLKRKSHFVKAKEVEMHIVFMKPGWGVTYEYII